MDGETKRVTRSVSIRSRQFDFRLPVERTEPPARQKTETTVEALFDVEVDGLTPPQKQRVLRKAVLRAAAEDQRSDEEL